MHVDTPNGPDRFRALYAANHDRVHRLLGRVAGQQDAEDLTQIVFTKAARALPRFRGSTPFHLGLPDRDQCRGRLAARPRGARGQTDGSTA